MTALLDRGRLGEEMTLRLLIALVAMADISLLGWLGFAEALGAHPGWAIKVAVIGGAIGAVLGSSLVWLGGLRAFAVAGAVTFLSGWASWNGKLAFVASLADDAAAGRAWFLGAIGFAAGLAALEVLLIRVLIQRYFDQAMRR